jgi:hypothetical protein
MISSNDIQFLIMSQEIATGTFYLLTMVTLALQLVMWYTRSKFLRTIKGQKNNSKIEELETMLRVVIPIHLTNVNGGQFENLRKSAVTASNCWIASLLLTLIVPIILFKLAG